MHIIYTKDRVALCYDAVALIDGRSMRGWLRQMCAYVRRRNKSSGGGGGGGGSELHDARGKFCRVHEFTFSLEMHAD